MTKEKKGVIWIVILFSLCLVTIFIVAKGTEAIKMLQKQEATSVKVSSEHIEKGIRLQTETKESDEFTSFVTIPLTENESIDVPIYQWIEEEEKSFFQTLETIEVLDDDEELAHFNLQTEIYKIDENLYSFILTEEQFIQNEHIKLVNTYTIDLHNEKFLKLTDIFTKKEFKEELNKLIWEKTKNKKQVKQIEKAFEDLETVKWSIQQDKLIFYVNPEDLNGSSNVVLTIELSLLDVYTYIEDSYKDRLITKKMAEEIEQIELENNERTLLPDGKYVALTFDDGPHTNVTLRILKTLEEYDAKATFYMLSKNVKQYPEIARKVAEEGHEIANHSNSHVNLNAVNNNRMKDELLESKKLIEQITGITPTTFRPPYGEYNATVLDIAKKSDQSVIMWSVDTLDWKTRNANAIYETVIQRTQPGSIILMHDIHEPTADALPMILKDLSNKDFEFVTVSELLPLLDDAGESDPYFGN